MDLAYTNISNGKYQTIISFIVIIISTVTTFLSAAFPFLNRRPLFLCKDQNNFSDHFVKCTVEEICDINDDLYFEKDPVLSSNNLSYDFDLYCEKNYYIGIFGTFFFLGGMIGTFIISPLPDRMGREAIFKFMILGTIILQFNLLFTFHPIHLAIVYLLSGVFQYAKSFNTIIIQEYLDRKNSGILISIGNVMFPLLGILTAVFFLFINRWRILILLLLAITIVTYFFALKYFVESPRWLNSKNRQEDCLASLRFMAATNGRANEFEDFLQENTGVIFKSNTTSNKKKSFNIIQIMRLKSQRLKLIVLAYCYFTCSFTHYGLVLNLDNLKGNFFIDSIITFVAEGIAILISGVLADRYGRLLTLKYASCIGGLAFIFFDIIGRSLGIGALLLFLTSFGFSATYNVMYIVAPEYFPTIIRSTCVGALYLMSRFGPTLVPTISALVPHSPVLFGAMACVSSYLLTYLPETLGMEIQDSIPECEGETELLVKTTNDDMKK